MNAQPFPLTPHIQRFLMPPPTGPKIRFVNPNTDNYDRNIRFYGELNKNGVPMIKQGMLPEGSTAIIVGSGPSLRSKETIDGIRAAVKEGAIVFACKAAIKFLYNRGIHIDYGVSMDPGAHIAKSSKIFKAPGITHIIATTSDPALYEYLKDENVMLFHSATGYKEETSLYKELFEQADVMGGGYNVVNRAVSAALYMGAFKIILAGTDCGWREDQEMYVDGPTHRQGVDMSDNGMVDGTPWITRPDMLASGVALAKLAKSLGEERMTILGDVLPAALRKKDDAFLKQCASFIDQS